MIAFLKFPIIIILYDWILSISYHCTLVDEYVFLQKKSSMDWQWIRKELEKTGLTEQEIVKKITDQYEVEQESAAHDVRQMIQKMYEVGGIGSVNQPLHIEEVFEKEGVFVSTTAGVSMYPMLRHRRDTIVIRPVTGRLKNMIFLYINGERIMFFIGS